MNDENLPTNGTSTTAPERMPLQARIAALQILASVGIKTAEGERTDGELEEINTTDTLLITFAKSTLGKKLN